MHKDKEGKPLAEGFYREHSLFGLPLYFIGKYDSSENAIAEDHKGLLRHSETETSEWLSVDDVGSSLRVYTRFREEIGRNLQWMAEKQSQLEQITKKLKEEPKPASSRYLE